MQFAGTVTWALVWTRIREPGLPSSAALCVSIWSVSPWCHLGQLEAGCSEGTHGPPFTSNPQFPEEPGNLEDRLNQAKGFRSVANSEGRSLNCTSHRCKKNKSHTIALVTR